MPSFRLRLTDLFRLHFCVGLSMASQLKRAGSFNYVAMLVAKAKPRGWQRETLLLRFVEQNGVSSMFIVTGDGIYNFDVCELLRIYEMPLTGRCVRSSQGANKYGVKNSLEVVIKYPCKLKLASVAWPLTFSYNFTDWDALNQVPSDAFVDIVGTVESKPILDANSPLPKLSVTLAWGNVRQDIFLLGEHSQLALQKGDVLACAGVKVREWEGQRSLQSTFLSHLEVNPRAREGLPVVQALEEGEPVRKAMRVSAQRCLPILDVERHGGVMVADARAGKPIVPLTCCIKGFLKKLDGSFFEDDAPLVGDEHREKMCWRTSLQDASGSVAVRVWDGACHELFSMTASGLRALWEEGVEQSVKRTEILERLNGRLEEEATCLCKVDVWAVSARDARFEFQVNVNAVDFV